MSTDPDDAQRGRDDDQWRDIVDRLGDDLFAEVPDIIATPVTTQPQSPSATPNSDSSTGSESVADDLWGDDEKFIPPSPMLPRFSRRTRLSWALIVGGISLLTSASLFRFTDTWSTLIGFGGILAGASSLVMRMSNVARDEDDDGAVV